MHGGRFTPKGGFDTLYLASDLATLGLEIGAVFGSTGAVSPTKDPFTVATVNGHLTSVLDLRHGNNLLSSPHEEFTPFR